MKLLSIFLAGCLTALATFAQNVSSVVTIKVNSNRAQEVLVDGKTYPLNSTTSVAGYNTITITDLQPGQHELQLVRTNQNNTGTRRSNSRNFVLRARYDLAITMNNDGTVELKETRNRNRGTVYNESRTPMTDANFSSLLNTIQSQTRVSAKRTAIKSAFTNTNNYFTTTQAEELIELVYSETNRLEFAKLAYPRITDPENVSQLYDLFNNQSNRDALAAYVANYKSTNPGYNTSTTNPTVTTPTRTAMTDAEFNSVMQNVKKQWLPGGKVSVLNDAFATSSNYFTVYQTKQLILLVSNEDNRLTLAKSAYDNIVDPSNSSQLYDLFTTQARKNELANYISSYSYNR